MSKYLPGYSYGMSGGPISISEQNARMRGNVPAPNRKIVASCVKCREAAMIWDYDADKEYPISSYYWRCCCFHR